MDNARELVLMYEIFMFFDVGRSRAIMEKAKELMLMLKQNKSHVGYGRQKECEALVSFILGNMAKSQLPPLKPEIKNKEESISYRECGNQHFVTGDDILAIESYTKSLAYADSNELMSLAHANRSAALYRQQMYKACLLDIDAAATLGYPQEKMKNLKLRGEKAMEGLRECALKRDKLSTFENPDKDNIPDDQLQSILDQFCSTGNKKNSSAMSDKFPLVSSAEDVILKKEKDMSSKTTDASKDKLIIECNVPRYLQDEDLKLVYGPSKETPAVSDGVEISFSEKYGRHMVATREFNPGDILAFEEPYSNVIYDENRYSYCSNCLLRCYCLIPCPHCPVSMYCSEKCKNVAWKESHHIECSVLAVLSNLLNLDEGKIRILSKIIRLVVAATDQGKGIDALQKDMDIAEKNPDNRTAGFTDDGKFVSMSARCALSLATNMSIRSVVDLSAFACVSALASVLLATQSTFYGKKYDSSELKDIIKMKELKFCGSVMLRACVICSANCFSVQPEPGIKVGSGLFVTHSLFNHACSANTFRHFYGTKMITRAIDKIYPGEQIFITYTGTYTTLKRAERKKKLQEEYYFDCQCAACVNDWPTYNETLKTHIGSISSRKDLVEKLKPYKKRLLDNKYDIDAVKRMLDILYSEAKLPCEEILHAQMYLKSYYSDP